MNILYISALEGGKYSGPLYSVPKQIIAQSKIDNVFWVNLTNISTASRFDTNLYHYIPPRKFKISELPTPFSKPDLIVFEEFFKVECCIVARQAEKINIPYIIIPRCQMTKKYLQNKKIKKLFASILLFSHFSKKAAAVQFLSRQEELDSIEYYNGLSFIVANGIDLPNKTKKYYSKNHLVGSFIGRYSIWQKGLDMLIEAISKKRKELIEANITFELYGPTERTGSGIEIEQLVSKFNVGDLVHVNGPVFDEEKKRVLLESDFFVHTSRFEGMPMSVLEALSYGLPCFVTQGSNLREAIDESEAGWGVDDNVGSIIKGMTSLIADRSSFKTKSYNALQLAEKYSWSNIAKESHMFFFQILNNLKDGDRK